MFFCKLDKKYFNFNEDLYVGAIYFPPENSEREKRLKEDHFKKLLEKVLMIKSNNIILIGDFNARTGSLDDVLLNDETKNDQNGIESPILLENIYQRNNQDQKTNKYGKKLINFCIQTSSYIANGRTLGDLQGSYTCCKYNGSSTVDYAIVSDTMHKQIKNF